MSLKSAKRREFLGFGIGLLLGINGESQVAWNNRWLWLRRRETGEEGKFFYLKNGGLDIEGYVQICNILRDVKANKVVRMDMNLLNTLFAIQRWLSFYRIDEPIEITSGYRTRKTNASIEGAALYSMHLYGAAADIIVPGLSAKHLADLAASLTYGGVGFYPQKGFVHVDTGRLRRWVS